MAALNFPSSPSTGSVYSANGWSWKYDGTAWVSAMQGSGYVDMPQIIITGSYTLGLGDVGKHLYHVTGSTATVTIPASASVYFQIGNAATVVNDFGGGTITLTSTDTMVLTTSGSGPTGDRTMASGSIATILKVAPTRWLVSGTAGVT
jgi:hypothetical protein